MLIPTQEQLNDAIAQLLNGDPWVDIVLPDWGKGKVAGFSKDKSVRSNCNASGC
jgi:hypothetical protein